MIRQNKRNGCCVDKKSLIYLNQGNLGLFHFSNFAICFLVHYRKTKVWTPANDQFQGRPKHGRMNLSGMASVKTKHRKSASCFPSTMNCNNKHLESLNSLGLYKAHGIESAIPEYILTTIMKGTRITSSPECFTL